MTELTKIAEDLLHSIAHALGCDFEDLGREWIGFADAVAEVVAFGAGPERVSAIGRLTIQAVALP